MSDCYVIVDLDGYVKEVRTSVAKSIAASSQDNLDEYISLEQMKSLVNSWCVGFDDEDRPILDEDSNGEIFEDALVWMTNVGLAKLAANDMIECAWDDNANEMVFWAKDQTKKAEHEQPTKDQGIKREN